MEEMLFGEYPRFDELLISIKKLEKEMNNI
jgi:hypothetical protein